jgi:hypothetical protein
MVGQRKQAVLAEVPQQAVYDRLRTLRRVLSDFPDPLLAALISGLELHGDDLRCGRLYKSQNSGCAVGAMIRQLHPEQFECGRMKFLVRHRWRKRAASYGGTLETGMHATLLEAIFDRAVLVTMAWHPDASERVASHVVGQWLLTEAERELGHRHDRIAAGLPSRINWRDLPLRRWGEGLDRRLALAHETVTDEFAQRELVGAH